RGECRLRCEGRSGRRLAENPRGRESGPHSSLSLGKNCQEKSLDTEGGREQIRVPRSHRNLKVTGGAKHASTPHVERGTPQEVRPLGLRGAPLANQDRLPGRSGSTN